MAGANSKRTAAANAQTLRQLQLGFLISATSEQAIYLVHLALFPSGRTFRRLALFGLTEAVAVLLWQQLQGMARRGEALDGRTGLVTYAFDVVYVTWATHVGAALVSVRFWYLYWIIPLYALYRLVSFALPYLSPSLAALLPGAGAGSAPRQTGVEAAAADGAPSTSKRQEKLRRRMEKGDPRVQQKEVSGRR
ncbi:hypothetical protein JCM21900_001318 [Sporobolomyces salmonicolor]